jgi:Fe-S-cluster-containing dehydrogenase component
MRLVRLIDTKRCIGCRACVAACMNENFYIPGNPWNLVIEREMGSYPYVKKTFIPMNCMHCEEPACKKACDYIGAHAISKNEGGVVIIDYEKCIGCKYCITVCPYGVPQFIEEIKTLFEEETPYDKIERNHPVHRKKAGVAEKCTFCWHRIEKAVQENRSDEIGVNPEFTPACDLVCPTGARVFGDIDNPDSEVSKKISSKRATQLKKHFGTKPQVYYVIDGGE